MSTRLLDSGWAQLERGCKLRTEQIAAMVSRTRGCVAQRMRDADVEPSGRSGRSRLWKAADVRKVFPELNDTDVS